LLVGFFLLSFLPAYSRCSSNSSIMSLAKCEIVMNEEC
jgi:hypothetical protein